MITSNEIIRIKKNNFNKKIIKKYLINGTEKNIKLDLEPVKSSEISKKQEKFGIVTYKENFKYGNKNNIPKNFNDIKEPLRILIDKNIYNEYVDNIKKLIIINTDKKIYKNLSFNELIKDFKYEIIYNNYKKNDLQNRYLPLPGKYNDARTIYQMILKNELKIENIDSNKKNLYDWFSEHIHIRKKIKMNIVETLNKLYNDDKYYFQKNHPLRFSINNNLGTPIHIDSCSKVYTNNKKFLLSENINNVIKNNKKYYETFQDENILNINYIINDNILNENQLRISTIEYDNIGIQEGYFFKVLLNYPNECFIFNASKFLHYKSYNHMDCYIRGDMRIIRAKDYNFEKFRLYRGPRMNFNVSFCIDTDIKKLNDDSVKYSVFENNSINSLRKL